MAIQVYVCFTMKHTYIRKYVHTYGCSFVYHSLAAAVGASVGVIGGLNGLIVGIVVFGLLLMW